jgi:regulator of chromosome condensation
MDTHKRRRESSEVGLSKNEYYASQLPSQSPGTFQKADDNIMAGRRQVNPRPANLTSALRAATKDLNARFVQYLLEQRNNRQGQMEETWEEALKDYVTYARHLKMHYRRSGGLVLACGSNDCGQSGHGREEDGTPIEPEGLAVVQSLRHVDIRFVATGGIHSLAVSSGGRVFSCGCNDDGALGRVTTDGARDAQPEFDFHEIAWFSPTGKAHCPATPTTTSTLSGPLFCINCVLIFFCSSLTTIFLFYLFFLACCVLANMWLTTVHVVQVAAGDCHSIALGLNGSVYTWGSYKDKDSKTFYNTGDATTCKGHTQKTPGLVRFGGDQCAVEIACGSCFNIARMRDGSVMTWGLGESGT